ncbi:MAG: HEAT repeat domain-containing protein [Verrucomicrobiales bacterium]|nr:HEAT repeat domain-containing protein [Verrucomicrobiales bacterium]
MAARLDRVHRTGLCAFLLVGGILLGWCVSRLGTGSSPGRTALVEALLADPGAGALIPNDVYGHLHDELEELLESGTSPDAAQMQSPEAVVLLPSPVPETAGARALREAGAEAGPVLLELLMARPTPWERIRERLGARLPIPALRFSAGAAAERRRMAGLLGFGILRERGVGALPGLSNLLHHAGAPMEAGLALGDLGEAGRRQLIDALASPDPQVRGTAALALGLEGSGDRRVLKGLLSALDQGFWEYHILGAIGRVGGDPGEIGRSVSRVLLLDPGPPACSVEEGMLVCLAGWCGPHAVTALPALERRRGSCDDPRRGLVERAIQRITVPAARLGAGNGNRDW